jgi:hypothetical protein
MSNTNTNPNGGEIKKDESIDLMSLLNQKPENNNDEESSNIQLSALDKAAMDKETQQKGLIVDNKDLKNEPEPLRSMTDTDQRREDVAKYSESLDKMTDIASKIIAPKVNNDIENMQLMTAIEEIAETGTVQTHNPIADKIIIKDENFDEKAFQENIKKEQASEESDNGSTERSTEELVNILIDKTGLGKSIEFTDEERERITKAKAIKITEVDTKELQTTRYIKPSPSNTFINQIESYHLSSASTPICFPASRFRAKMNGLSYGELGDLALDPDNITFDQVRKKLSVIYNKLSNANIGKFESFDDFLKKFAYIDMDMAVYGLIVSTFPEEDTIELSCGNPNCPKASRDANGELIKASFDHKYSPRSLIEFDRCGQSFLDYTEKIADCKPSEYQELFESSSVQTYKAIKLPDSGFIVEVGIASAYDYLYQILDVLLSDEGKEVFEDDVNHTKKLSLSLLSIVRSVSIPNENGEYAKYTDGTNIVNALYEIKPREIKILGSILNDTTEKYASSFAFKDVVCPHCGRVTKRVPVDINTLVFTAYQLLVISEINIENTLSL